MKNKEKILLIDDEPDIIEFLKYNLEKVGYKISTAYDGPTGLKLMKEVKPDLVILDVMMPQMDGMEVCATIREDKTINQPLIAFLTSRSEDYSQISGFDVGGDDYIAKPIRPRVLVSRIEALLRRGAKGNAESPNYSNEKLFLDRDRFILIFDDQKIQLPKKEFELLELLISKPGKVFNREEILAKVWGNETIVGERTIDVHVRKLREKIGDDYIRTIKGVGYTYDAK